MTSDELKERIVEALETLPPEALQELVNYLDYIRFKLQLGQEPSSSEAASGLEGILEGYRFSAEEIEQARREMWGGLGENLL